MSATSKGGRFTLCPFSGDSSRWWNARGCNRIQRIDRGAQMAARQMQVDRGFL